MQGDGLLTPVQAGEMDRFFAERQALINARLPMIEQEFLQRRDRDGNESAMAWLRDTKQQMQRDQYDATRSMIEGLGISEQDIP